MPMLLTNHGTYAISGAALKTKVDGLTPRDPTKGFDGEVSGSILYIIPVDGTQTVQVIQVDVA